MSGLPIFSYFPPPLDMFAPNIYIIVSLFATRDIFNSLSLKIFLKNSAPLRLFF